MFPRLEGPRRRNYSAPSNSMQPRGFLRMHIFMDGMRIVWRACRCSGVDATRIYSRASKRRARAIRASSLDTASPDRSPASLRACRLPLRIPSTRGFSSVPKDADGTSGGGMEREPFSILLRVLRSCDTSRDYSVLSLRINFAVRRVCTRKWARKTRRRDIFRGYIFFMKVIVVGSGIFYVTTKFFARKRSNERTLYSL